MKAVLTFQMPRKTLPPSKVCLPHLEIHCGEGTKKTEGERRLNGWKQDFPGREANS
jgi:hypothetical protein